MNRHHLPAFPRRALLSIAQACRRGALGKVVIGAVMRRPAAVVR
jgi:hypothetical protein